MFAFYVVLCDCMPTCRDTAKRHDMCRSFLRRHLAVTHDMSSRHLQHVMTCLFKTQNFASKRHVILRHSQLSGCPCVGALTAFGSPCACGCPCLSLHQRSSFASFVMSNQLFLVFCAAFPDFFLRTIFIHPPDFNFS